MRRPPLRAPVRAPAEEPTSKGFARDVGLYLSRTPRQLPSRYLYDRLGSALFEAICQLPWYAINRAETALLDEHAAEILTAASPVTDIVELGPGNGEKLGCLLAARPSGSPPLRVHLVDVSAAALTSAATRLGTLADVQVVLHQATYETGLEEAGCRPAGGRTLAVFLGSNIGNFDPPGADELLRRIHHALRPGDLFLLGADLVKPERELLSAYDDPLQVTAAFNRNLLVRINRELGGTFDLASFRHRAVWNAERSRVEMHLVSTRPQRVRIPGAGLEFTMRDGEFIWTESSYKYMPDDLAATLVRAGFTNQQAWTHPTARFALTLAGLSRERSGAMGSPRVSV
jgi:dimethylhistidine N-methyltransferase